MFWEYLNVHIYIYHIYFRCLFLWGLFETHNPVSVNTESCCNGNVRQFDVYGYLFIICIVGADFVDRHRGILIQKVTSVMEIADCLEGRKMITREMYRNVEAKATSHEQMRELYKHLESGGRAAKAEFYQILKEKQPCLVMDLESRSAQA